MIFTIEANAVSMGSKKQKGSLAKGKPSKPESKRRDSHPKSSRSGAAYDSDESDDLKFPGSGADKYEASEDDEEEVFDLGIDDDAEDSDDDDDDDEDGHGSQYEVNRQQFIS